MGGATRFLLLLSPPPPLLLHRNHLSSSLLRLSVLNHRRYYHRHQHLRFSPSLASPQHHHFSISQPRIPSHFPVKSSSKQLHSQYHFAAASSVEPIREVSSQQQWPEWSGLLDTLFSGGYFNMPAYYDAYNDDFLCVAPEFPEEFLSSAYACLAFARDRPNLLGMLSRRDIEVVVEKGAPFLFKNGQDSSRRLRLFLAGGVSNASDMDQGNMVDLMRFLLSYASSHTSSGANNLYGIEFVESSVRNLLGELGKLSYGIAESNFSGTVQNQFADRYGQAPRSFGQNIEMKKGDWICSRCSFMNFARNMKCLECEEARPKRQLTGGEWECPQCDFLNYGRNKVCLRCECKRPGDISFGPTNSGSGLGYGEGNYSSKIDTDSRLAANEEKAQRWFSKVSQLDGTSDMNSAIADEDFPEIMPLRKGVNRFVVSTRKTPLERRLANAQYRNNSGSVGTSMGTDQQMMDPNKTLDTKAHRSLDEILGRSPAGSESSHSDAGSGQNAVTVGFSSNSTQAPQQYVSPRGTDSSFPPFVPLPSDMFVEKPENPKIGVNERGSSDQYQSFASNTSEQSISGSYGYDTTGESLQLSEKPTNQYENSEKEKEEAEKTERWFKKVAELHNVSDLTSAIPDEDFPEIMPMRKGENRFVLNKNKDRSLTSPAYKRRAALEQASNSNFVPFVPFPPDYFAKKDNQQAEGTYSTSNGAGEASNTLKTEKKSSDQKLGGSQKEEVPTGSWNEGAVRSNFNENKTSGYGGAQTSGFSTQNSFTYQNNSSRGEYSDKESIKDTSNSMGRTGNNSSLGTGSSQPTETQNMRSKWSGKSLEGSAVKESDPLDMSEEAKAERWFKRVAQIKDISELSQIPDEDFPSIMPMRKGVNRFVVSKRKTPLERRLTSQQYRRNLPIVNSDPLKNEDDKN